MRITRPLLILMTAAVMHAQGCRAPRLPDQFRYDDRSTDLPGRGGDLVLRWLGAAGYEVRKGDTTVLIDPFISRPRFRDVAFGVIRPDAKAIRKAMADGRLAKKDRSWLLREGDLTSPGVFLAKLLNAHDPLGTYLRKHLSKDFKQRAKGREAAELPPETIERDLRRQLNQLLQAEDFYERERFRDRRLPSDLQQLARRRHQGDDLIRLNRRLLQSAYPGQIRTMRSVDYIFVSHSHYDHLMDVGFIAKATGATVVGSKSACNIMRSRHIHETRLIEVEGGEEIEAGAFRVRIIRSLHVRTRLGGVVYPGEVTGIITRPTRAIDYRVGKVFGFFFLEKETGFTFYHNGSANLIDENLQGLQANLVIMSIANMKNTKDYVRRLLTPLSPNVVIPTHYDDFYVPFDKGLQLMDGVDIEGFAREARAVNPNIRVLTLDFFQEYRPRGYVRR